MANAPAPSSPLFLKQVKKVTPSFWEPSKLVHVNFWNTLKLRCYTSYYTKSIENIIITLYTFTLNFVFTTDICFGYILPLMFFIFDMQKEWTQNIPYYYIIKSGVCIKLKYIQTSLDIYQNISYYTESKKKEKINISTMKTHQMPSKWQYLTCNKVSFSNQNLQNDIVT